jgi:hypothetical protein
VVLGGALTIASCGGSPSHSDPCHRVPAAYSIDSAIGLTVLSAANNTNLTFAMLVETILRPSDRPPSLQAVNVRIDSLLGGSATATLVAVVLDTIQGSDRLRRQARWYAAALLGARDSGVRMLDSALGILIRPILHDAVPATDEASDRTLRALSQVLGVAKALSESPHRTNVRLPNTVIAICTLRDAGAPTQRAGEESSLRRVAISAGLLFALEQHTSTWTENETSRLVETWPLAERAALERQIQYVRRLTRGP